MYSITKCISQLKSYVKRLQLTQTLEDYEYALSVVHAIQRLYTSIGREDYDENKLVVIDDEQFYDQQFVLIDTRYIFIAAQIECVRMLQMKFGAMVSYTTNALSVTNADKPWANMEAKLSDLQKQLNNLHYNHYTYTVGV